MVPTVPRAASATKLKVLFGFFLVLSASFGCSKEDTKEARLLRANSFVAAGEYDKAEQEYREVLRLAPADPVAERQLAIVYHDQGQLARAYPLLKKIAELQPDDLEIQLKLGQTLLNSREYQQVRDIALRILETHPGDEQALLLLADSVGASSDDIEETRKIIEELRKKDQERAGYYLALGALDLQQKNDAGAETNIKTALKLDQRSSLAYAGLAAVYLGRNDLKAAGEAFKTAADLDAPRSTVRMRYADFLLKTGAREDAKKVLDEISQKLPEYLPARALLMRLACAEHQDEDCAARVQKILTQDPSNFDGLFQDGILNLAKGDASKAVRDYGYLSSVYTGNPQVRYQLARAYLLLAEKTTSAVDSRSAVESAETSLNEAIKLDPRFNQATLLLAELKISKGSPAAAMDLLEPLVKERPQLARAQWLLAAAYLNQGKTDQALGIYEQMTQSFPQYPSPYLTGRILLKRGERAGARKAFEDAAETSAAFLPATEMLVDMDIADQQYGAAIDRVQKQIDKDPKAAQAWALRGKIYFAQRDFKQAEADLSKAIELDPNLQSAYLLLSQLYVASNKEQQAIEELNAAVEKNKTVPALMQLGVIHERLEHFAEARETYEKLLTVDPNFSPALNNLAVLYSEHLGQLDRAYELAKKAKEATPNSPQITDTLGWILFKRGDYGNALQMLQEAAGKLPDNPAIQFNLGMAHYVLGEEEPARIALQKAAQSSADFPGKDEARQRLAMLTIDVGAANDAVRKELENYLRERPNDPVALMRLAQVQKRDGDVDEAVKTYEKVLADYPLHAPAMRQLALLYGQRSTDEPKAYELATKAQQAYPDDPEIAKTLGILNYRRGLYSQSVDLLKKAAAKRKDDAELLYYLGQANCELKQWDECKEALQRALSLKLAPGLAVSARRALADFYESPR